MIERLFASPAPAEEVTEEVEEEDSDEMKLTSLQSITDFMTCAGRTLPDNIRGVPGREKTCTESTVHYDEYSVEK